MTMREEVAPGVSASSPRDMPRARAIRKATARVGLAWLRSTWLSIDRLTPEALARASSDQPREVRSCLSRRAKWLLVGSSDLCAGLGRVFLEELMGKSLKSKVQSLKSKVGGVMREGAR